MHGLPAAARDEQPHRARRPPLLPQLLRQELRAEGRGLWRRDHVQREWARARRLPAGRREAAAALQRGE